MAIGHEVGEPLALVALAATMLTAALRPRWQAPVAAGGAVVVLVAGAVPAAEAGDAVTQLGPVVGFLIAVLVLSAACGRAGLFAAAGDRVARWSAGSPARLLTGGVTLAAVSTAVLSLDTTVVLVTPVLTGAAGRAQLRPRPVAYAAAHLANSASLLLPVSNLTNLLVVAAVPIGFGRFTGLMVLPWLFVVVVEWAGLRLCFRDDLAAGPGSPPVGVPVRRWPVPAAVVVALTLAGFAAASAAGVAVAWPAAGGAVALLVVEAVTGPRPAPRRIVADAQLGLAVFALGLAVIVRAVGLDGVDRVLRSLAPGGGDSVGVLLGWAVLAAVLANLANNLPATLLLLPLLAGMTGGVGPALAVLIGVDVGPNLTYPGSLATLLWRRQVGGLADLRRWSLLAALTVPAGLVAAVLALRLALSL